MGAFSCLCLPVAKRAPDVNGDVELKSACEKVAVQKTSSGSERTLTYADLCGPSKGSAVSPFEAALAIRGASAPRLSFQGTTSRSPLLSPFDSVKSFPTFLSAASYPSSVEEDDAAPGKPPLRSSMECPADGVLGHFDLDRLDTARLHDLSSSQPPSPKTPLQGESFSKGSRHGDRSSSSSEALHSNNPIRGHPRYRKLKQLQGRGRRWSSQRGVPLTLLCKDEDTGQLAVLSFMHRGTSHVQACEPDILNMRTCNAHPFIMHLHQAFVTREYLAVVTEHGPGGVLSDYILEHSSDVAGMGLREDVARSFFQQLMVAVDFCHAMGIRIQDLRPHNMLLVEHNDAPSLCSIASTGDPCVLPEGGLGMSGVPRLKLMLTQMQQESPEVCSDDSAAPAYSRADYAAPEVSAEKCEVDTDAADMWSCGVLLHHMLTGGLPSHPRIRPGSKNATLDPAQSQADRQGCMKLKGLSTACRHLLSRLLRADPRKRATVSEIMRHPWFQTDCPQGLEEVNTELIIMLEEGLTESFSSQGELELKATLERARQVRVPSVDARPQTHGI